MSADKLPGGKNVAVQLEDGIAWVALNRPEKRNCMNPALNDEMVRCWTRSSSTTIARFSF